MGLLDALRAIFTKKAPLETIDLKFSQVDVFVSQHADKLKAIEQRAQQFKQELKDKFHKIRQLLVQLKQAEPGLEIRASKLCVVGESIRDKFYETAIRAIDALPDGVQLFYIESQNAFKILNLDMRKADILLMVFKEQMTEFSKVLVDLKKELDVFKKFVKKDLAVIRKYDELREIMVKTKDCRTNISKSEKDLAKIKGEIDFYDSKKQNIAKQLDELHKSKTSPEIQELGKEAEELENKNKAICSEIDSKFSEIKKLLKKFEYLVSQEKYSANQRMIKEYLKSPSQAVLNDQRLHVIEILSEFKKALGKDISLDQKQQTQLPLLIDLLTEEYFRKKQEEHKVNYGLLQANYSQKTQILTPLVFKERALEKESKLLDRNIEQVQKDYDKQDKILTKYKDELDDRYAKLSSLVSEVTSLPVIVAD